MRRSLCLLLLALLWALPVQAQEDLLDKVVQAHAKIQNGTVDALVDVVTTDLKGSQESRMAVARPKMLAWRNQVKLPSETVEDQVVTNGDGLYVYNSREKKYLKFAFAEDVLVLAEPDSGLGLGVQSIILQMMSGKRDTVIGLKKLSIPIPTPDAAGECMFELGSEVESNEIYVDAKTYQVKRVVAKRDGQVVARAALTYQLTPPDPKVFKFVPPPGASLGQP